MFTRAIDNTSCCNLNNEDILRETNRTYSRSKYLLSETQKEDENQCHWEAKVDGNFRNAMASLP